MSDDEIESNLKEIVDSAGFIFLGTILELAIAFLAKALMAQYLAVEDYGVVSLGILTINVTTTIALLGLDKGISRFLPRLDHQERRLGVVLSAYGIALPLGLFFAAIVYALAPWIATNLFRDPVMTTVLRVMFLGIPVWVLLTLGEGVVRGLEQTLPRILVRNVLLPGTRFLFVAGVVALGWGIAGVAGAYVASYAISAVVITYFSVRGLTLGLSYEVRPVVRDVLAFSIPLTVVGFSSFILRNIDLVILGYYRGTNEVGIYNVAYPIARLLTTMPTAFGYLLVPIVSRMHAKGDIGEATRLYQVITKWLFILASPLFALMVLFPDAFIFIFGQKYSSGSATLIVLSVGFFVSNVLGNNGGVLQSVGKSGALMWVQVVAMCVNLGLNFALIPTYGFFGAGIATAVSYVFRDLLTSGLLYRYTDIHPVTRAYFLPGTLVVVVSAVAYVLGTRFFDGSTLAMLAVYGVFIMSLLGSFLAFGIEAEDLELIDILDDKIPVNIALLKSLLRRFSA